jgi:hypothetical protein
MYRSSDLDGVFVLTDEEYEFLREINGFTFHYGEIAGKHSDVSRELDFNKIEILSDKEEEIAFFERILPYGAGFSFKDKWFDMCAAYDGGWEAGGSKCFAIPEEAFEDYRQFNNSLMKHEFIKGFNKRRSE